ncbi:hypothetical protein T492DRAFT_588126, partial [Pavlovales sp. CCMP2436]
LLAALGGHFGAAVLSGETGCGKSTQVPQLLLDDAVARGEGGRTRIIVTQPRRVAASSLATRVAAERGEAAGQTVGYAVRGDRALGQDTRIAFVTTGASSLLYFLEEERLQSFSFLFSPFHFSPLLFFSFLFSSFLFFAFLSSSCVCVCV